MGFESRKTSIQFFSRNFSLYIFCARTVFRIGLLVHIEKFQSSKNHFNTGFQESMLKKVTDAHVK